MCCESTETFDLPREVIETLAYYRRLLNDRGWDWAGEGLDFFRAMRFAQLSGLPELVRHAARGGWAKAVVAVIGKDVPAGVVVIRIDEGGGLQVETGPARPAIAGDSVAIDVVIDSDADTELRLTLGGRDVHVAARGSAVETIDVGGGDPVFKVRLGSQVATVRGAVRAARTAQLRLISSRCVRWSVTDSTGGAWFPAGVLPKWDYHHRPFFHSHDLSLNVPAEALQVVCTRGLEYERAERLVSPVAGDSVTVECDPARLFDPAAEGWYGGDLHVHMNYSGDLCARQPMPPACSWVKACTCSTWWQPTVPPPWSSTATCWSSSAEPTCRGRVHRRWPGWGRVP